MSDVNWYCNIDWDAVSTLIAGFALLLAIILPFISDYLYRRPNKTKLEFDKPVTLRQNEGYIGRLIVTNKSKHIATTVEASVVKITEDGTHREGFLPVPLNWTHIDETRRDIQGNQTVYLDVIQYVPSDAEILFDKIERTSINMWLSTPIQKSGVDVFYRLYLKRTVLEICLYQDNGNRIVQKVEIVWENNIPELKLV